MVRMPDNDDDNDDVPDDDDAPDGACATMTDGTTMTVPDNDGR